MRGDPWTDDENRILFENLHRLNTPDLAKLLPGRTVRAIRSHVNYLKRHGKGNWHHVDDPTSKWATKTVAERLENKAACVIALYLRRKELSSVDRQVLADALGVHRATLERYMATVDKIPEYLDALDEVLRPLARK